MDTEGKVLQGANDLVFDDDGHLWFTGPGSLIAPEPEERETIFKVGYKKLIGFVEE